MQAKYTWLLLMICFTLPVRAQHSDTRIPRLQEKILEIVPDLKCTRRALGTTKERPERAREHAEAIVAAADTYASRWETFAKDNKWENFDAHRDLPALISAITFRESAFQSVIRLNNNTIVASVAAAKAEHPDALFDAGVMQVRVPSAPARRCGVDGTKDIQRIIKDLRFAYAIGTCVLTNHIAHYSGFYAKEPKRMQLRVGQRPDKDLKFFGVFGERKGTPKAELAKELLVIERYNWGNADLYKNSRSAGYARRVLTLFEFFQS